MPVEGNASQTMGILKRTCATPFSRTTSFSKRLEMELKEIFWNGILQPRGGVDEKCFFEPLGSGGPCPPFRLTIDEFSSDTKEPICKVVATTHIDGKGQDFVAAHPLWSKDCRPFLLWQIFEAFWQVKLMSASYGQAEVLNVGLQDSKRGSMTTVEISAEVFYEGGGSPTIHLPNYANTHIYDQLRKVYEVNPEALPSPDWLTQTKERVLRERVAAELEAKRTRTLRLRRRRTNADPVTLFMDETGDLGFLEAGHYYMNCGVVVKDAQLGTLRNEIRGVIDSNWSGSRPGELHFTKIPSTKLSLVTDALAEIFLARVEDAVFMGGENLDFCRHLLRCEAEYNRAMDHPVQTNLAELLADENAHPKRKLLILSCEELITHVGVDCLISGSNFNVVHDRKHRGWMNDALKTGFERSKETIRAVAGELYGREILPDMQFSVEASEAEPCLWLSDWIAWEFGAWLRGSELSPAFKRVQSKIRFFTFGDRGQKIQYDGPGGVQLNSYPDEARNIATIL